MIANWSGPWCSRVDQTREQKPRVLDLGQPTVISSNLSLTVPVPKQGICIYSTPGTFLSHEQCSSTGLGAAEMKNDPMRLLICRKNRKGSRKDTVKANQGIPWWSSGSVQFSSVTQSCPTLCDPMACSTPGLPVHHQLPEPTQTHVHWVGDAIQPSHPLSSPSPPTFSHSQNQGMMDTRSQFFASGGQSIRVSASTSVLPMNIQDWFPLGWTGWISLQSKGLSRVFFNTTFQKHQFFGTQLSL